MINIEVKYNSERGMFDKEIIRGEYIIKLIDGKNKSEHTYHTKYLGEEMDKIFKNYKGIYSVRFYFNGG